MYGLYSRAAYDGARTVCLKWAGLLMGDDIKTGRSTNSDFWAALHCIGWAKIKTAIDDRPEPIPSITQLSLKNKTCAV